MIVLVKKNFTQNVLSKFLPAENTQPNIFSHVGYRRMRGCSASMYRALYILQDTHSIAS